MIRAIKNPSTLQKCAHKLGMWGVPLLPRLIDYFVRWWFACWYPHTIEVGEGTSLGYGGLGCVIHSDTVLGRNVHIGAGVLIGTNGRATGVPVIEDSVYIGFGSAILGPITVGRGSVVGANSVVLHDVPPNVVVAGAPARIIRRNIDSMTHISTMAETAPVKGAE